MLKIYVIDADASRRAQVCRSLMDARVHAEPFETIEEFFAFNPQDGIILAHDDPDHIHRLLATVEDQSWLPVILYARSPTMPRVVAAMQAGIASYLPHPLDLDGMLEEYEKLREFFAIQYERRRRESTARNLVDTLSTREREILTCMLDFGTSKEIARHLGISPRTVETHKANLMARLQVKTSTQAIRVAMEGGVFSIGVDDLPLAEESVGLAAPPTMDDGFAPDPEPRIAASG